MQEVAAALRGDILARLLLVQSTAGHLPDESSMIDFACRGLEMVPGVGRVRNVATDDAAEVADETLERYPLRFGGSAFGEIWLKVTSREEYAPYAPHVQNLLYVLGLMLEERRQRRLAEEHQHELERRVAERTLQLSHEVQERRAAEERALAAMARAEAEKERLDVTLRSIGDGVITTDTQGAILVMNAVAEQLTGWNAQEAMGRLVADVFVIIDVRTNTRAEDPVMQVLSTQSVVELSDHFVIEARDGTQRAVLQTASPIRHHDRVVGAVLVFRDVTERNRLIEQNQRAERLDAVGVLAGGIAHDFNNLLAGIFGNLCLAREQALANSVQAAALDEALQVFQRARDLTRQLLTFSKGGAPVRSIVDLRKLLVDCTRFALSGSRIAPCLRLPTELPSVAVDASQIWRVIDNLVRNSVQAMPRGGSLTISGETVRLTRANPQLLPEGLYVCISVADDGPGIPPELLTRIFDPFFTTKEHGSGLGLATAYSVVKRHEGHIEVESQVGVGSTFKIYLPVTAAPGVVTIPPAKSARHQGSGRALVLDDEPYLCRLFERFLTRLGYEVTLVNNGQDAISAVDAASAEKRPFRVALLDLTIPGGMGGKEAVSVIRRTCPGLVTIAASGYSDDPIMAYPKEYGFDASLGKPFALPELEGLLNALVELKTTE